MSSILNFSHQVKDELSAYLGTQSFGQIAVLVDENTKQHCYQFVKDVLPAHILIEIPSGEKHKTISTCEHIWSKLTEAGFDRHSLLINLGGGVIGDMGGFCARTFKRGIEFLNIPTTLLAMVDANIGGKLGIDFNGLKNHIGLFSEPRAVFIDPVFLTTLPQKEILSGKAEMIKHGFIAIESHLNTILATSDVPEMKDIKASVAVKSKVVAADPTEQNVRKTLNFGHTLGHAVETHLLGTERHLLHGEAVIAGIIMELYLSKVKCGFDPEKAAQLTEQLLDIYKLPLIEESEIDSLIALATQDKKNKNSQIFAVLLKEIGDCEIDVPLSPTDIRAAIVFYNVQVR